MMTWFSSKIVKNPTFTFLIHGMNEGYSHFWQEKIKNFIFILVEIWLVELKLKFVVFCYTQIGPFLFKNREKKFFWGKNPPYDLPLTTLRKILKCIKWRKILKIVYFIIILFEIWLVELKLEFVTFYRNQISPFLSKNGQNHAILA